MKCACHSARVEKLSLHSLQARAVGAVAGGLLACAAAAALAGALAAPPGVVELWGFDMVAAGARGRRELALGSGFQLLAAFRAALSPGTLTCTTNEDYQEKGPKKL